MSGLHFNRFCLSAVLLALLAACGPTSGTPAPGQRVTLVADEDQSGRFTTLRASDEYVRVIHDRALKNDERRNAQCTERRVKTFELDRVVSPLKFFKDIRLPLEGEWSERVTVDSCGRMVEHRIHVIATLRGMLAVAPPGESLTDLRTQLDIARALTTHEQARDTAASCPQWRIENAMIAARPDAERRWRERWTIDACGAKHNYLIFFAPGDTEGTIFRIQPEAT